MVRTIQNPARPWCSLLTTHPLVEDFRCPCLHTPHHVGTESNTLQHPLVISYVTIDRKKTTTLEISLQLSFDCPGRSRFAWSKMGDFWTNFGNSVETQDELHAFSMSGADVLVSLLYGYSWWSWWGWVVSELKRMKIEMVCFDCEQHKHLVQIVVKRCIAQNRRPSDALDTTMAQELTRDCTTT